MAYAIRFARLPVFPCLFSNSIMAGVASASINSIQSLTTIPILPPDCDNTLVFLTLRKISVVIDLPNLNDDDKGAVVSDVYNIQHRLLLSLNATSVIAVCDLQHAFKIAALLYLDLFIREHPNRSRLHDNLLSRLTVVLSSSRWDLKFIEFAGSLENRQIQWMKQVLTWIVFVALSASRERFARAKLVAVLGKAIPEVCRLKLDEVKAMHGRVVWRHIKCSQALEELWRENYARELALVGI